MKTNSNTAKLGIALFMFAVSISVSAQAPFQFNMPEPLKCTDKKCLIELVDNYFKALVAHDPSKIPFAMNARFVENVDSKPIGEGLWQTASAAPTTFKIYVPDPTVREVGFLGMMEEQGKPVMIALRLKISDDGFVNEAEHLIARGIDPKNMKYLQTVRPGILTAIPEKERMKRYEMVGIAYSYYDALIMDNGFLSPMADDCTRRENGSPASNSGIPDNETDESPNYSALKTVDQLNTNMMDYINDIDNVRVFAIDPEAGLAIGFSHFRHEMNKKTFPIYNVPGVTSREMQMPAFDLPAAHVFKISKGQIHEIEAMGFLTKYMALSGWE
ncbi:MAG: hypothetical protein LBT25_10550 [Candidatus Symbiothrix sp.]|jgi:hypothetical protein|nr:hypothetical protein [Candidatus Symbiothrix sp.]